MTSINRGGKLPGGYSVRAENISVKFFEICESADIYDGGAASDIILLSEKIFGKRKPKGTNGKTAKISQNFAYFS